MEGHLGVVDVTNDPVLNPFFEAPPDVMALIFIGKYGGIDGQHHKDWVLDQAARILNDTPVIVSLASWDNGHTELRFVTGEASQKYHDWVREMVTDEDGTVYEDMYDVGIAP
jgi:hypothetical protein